ncbi:Transketolase [Pirellulimonas nuda]|uniref:Transketolase n=1 Tax=Pirellulimonas nuda TaxID=2528009 RepID=A0A518DB43_9BACT|nr:transketolase [Pirellulimonas nuda]QDU88711.1 Transketolase [Pirellulimonas nuda]
MPTTTTDLSQTAINTIRTLAMDGVQAANSGHPGTPMALAPVTYKLWADVLRYDPAQPLWPGRDRYVLSCGHASMLLYAMIHLAGIRKVGHDGIVTDQPALPLEELKNFRQMGSLTPGHPEHGHTTGVETTTGPLGQGCGNSVGMAIAERWMAARYNKPGFNVFDYNVYAQCSDGDLMEGVACEAASLAGHLKLANLCWIYDDNKITIEGDTDLAFSEDVPMRFRGLGWNVVKVDDANDLDAFGKALQTFHKCDDAPTLIVVRSVIAWGSPNKAGTHGAHGSPLGDEEIRLTKEAYGWPTDEKFFVPEEVKKHFADTLGARGAKSYAEWQKQFVAYKQEHAALAAELELIWSGGLPKGWDAGLPEFPADAKGIATRASGGKSLAGIAANLPWLVGGSADLAPSTNTLLAGEGDFEADSYGGRNLHWGIREHAMAAAANGMALAGLRPYVATFFVFSDYLRPSMRLAALMKQPVVYVFTHDSIGVGEDGPTHQPVEQLAAARAIPGLVTIRPGDANEAAEAWRAAINNQHRPTALVLTRQNLPTLDRAKYAAATGLEKGAYILADAKGGKPDVLLMATGSELSLAVEAYETLTASGVAARVVSMPSFELFEDQPQSYRDSVLPPSVSARVGIEVGIQQCWDRYLGLCGKFIGMDDFGASAPYNEVYEARGITVEAVVKAAKSCLS